MGICTSARGKDSNTYFLMKRAFDSVSGPDVESEIVVASELKLRPCDHHYSMDARMCVHPCLITQMDGSDEMRKIYDGIISSDIVVFSTPVHWGNHSQLMQLIVERLNSLENANSVHGQVVVKNKIAGLMILGHEDGYQSVAGGLMSFLSAMGMIFPPQAYAAWVGESDEDTKNDRRRIETDVAIKDAFSDLMTNLIGFTRQLLTCPDCGRKFDHEHRSRKKNYIDLEKNEA